VSKGKPSKDEQEGLQPGDDTEEPGSSTKAAGGKANNIKGKKSRVARGVYADGDGQAEIEAEMPRAPPRGVDSTPRSKLGDTKKTKTKKASRPVDDEGDETWM